MKAPAIGLVGCGNWGQLILRDLKTLGATVVVVARSSASIARARIYGADHIVAEISDLPTYIDGIVIATPMDKHAAAIETLIPRAIPIFVEKPMTHDITTARTIVERAPDRIFVMDKWRYHPGIEALKNLSGSGRIGCPIALHMFRWGWSTTHHELDPIWLLAPHDLSIALHINGRVPIPFAAHGRILGSRAAELTASLLGENAMHVHIDISTLRPMHQRIVALVGEDGSAQLSSSYDHKLTIRFGSLGAEEADEEELALPQIMPLEEELRCFLKYLRGGPPPMSSAAEGLAVIEAIVEMRKLAGLDP